MTRLQHLFFTACFALVLPAVASAQFYYTGAAGGDFYDEANWTANADGTGANPAGDVLFNDAANAIGIDLIIDNDSVVANGQVDFGSGSLMIGNGAEFTITGVDNQLDINSASTFSLMGGTLTVEDDIFFEGDVSFVGGSVTSVADDVEFQDNLTSLSIDGTTFTSLADNIVFDAFLGTVNNATFVSADRLGVRNAVAIVMSDTDIDVQSGLGDVDDVFGAAGLGSSLTLLGASTLLADSVEEEADLILGGSTVATMGGGGERITADGSTITMTTTDATLVIASTLVDDPRADLINGLTGESYLDNPSAWTVTDWNGTDEVSLSIVPEPSLLALMVPVGLLLILRRKS